MWRPRLYAVVQRQLEAGHHAPVCAGCLRCHVNNSSVMVSAGLASAVRTRGRLHDARAQRARCKRFTPWSWLRFGLVHCDRRLLKYHVCPLR